MEKTITLYKGGSNEKTVPLSEIQVPDMWHLALAQENTLCRNKILECWQVAHALLNRLREDNDPDKVTVTIELSRELRTHIVTGIMGNFPDASDGSTLICNNWHYPDDKPDEWRFDFQDTEDDGKSYHLTMNQLLDTVPLLFSKHWSDSKGLTQPPASSDPDAWENWLCQADATDFDAFVQLACFGKIIYG